MAFFNYVNVMAGILSGTEEIFVLSRLASLSGSEIKIKEKHCISFPTRSSLHFVVLIPPI